MNYPCSDASWQYCSPLWFIIFADQMPKDITDYARGGDIEGVKRELAAGVSINFQNSSVSYRFYILCLHGRASSHFFLFDI